jgi:hypothetical protein
MSSDLSEEAETDCVVLKRQSAHPERRAEAAIIHEINQGLSSSKKSSQFGPHLLWGGERLTAGSM